MPKSLLASRILPLVPAQLCVLQGRACLVANVQLLDWLHSLLRNISPSPHGRSHPCQFVHSKCETRFSTALILFSPLKCSSTRGDQLLDQEWSQIQSLTFFVGDGVELESQFFSKNQSRIRSSIWWINQCFCTLNKHFQLAKQESNRNWSSGFLPKQE